MKATFTDIKNRLREGRYTSKIYFKIKDIYYAPERLHKFRYKGKYIDRSKGSEYLCVVLAGYKDFLYPYVFKRLKKFLPEYYDCCIVSSGIYSEELNRICDSNGWSYLSIRRNNVCLAQNVAISKHPQAKWIFKLDEDIFVTEGFFDNMVRAYECAKKTDYNPGVLAPTIPLNGYGYMRVLDHLEKREIFEDMFGIAKYTTGAEAAIEHNTDVAKFFWGQGG